MVSLNRLTRKKLGEILLEQGLVSEQQVQDALRLQHQQGILFGEALVQQGIITESKMVSVLIDQFGLPYVEASQYQVSEELLGLFDPVLMRRYQFVPLDLIGPSLIVAISGLLSEDLIHKMEHETACTVRLYLTRISEIEKVLSSHGMGR